MRLHFADTSRKKSIAAFLKEWENSTDYISVNTSGSTGVPKTIQLRKDHMLISARKTLSYLKIPPLSTFHLGLSTQTIAGKMMLVRALVNEAELIVSEVSTKTFDKIKKPIHFTAMVPLQLEKYLQENSSLPIETILVGGAAIGSDLAQKAAKSKAAIFHTFGMTETISHVALKSLSNNINNIYHALPEISFSTNINNELIISFPEISELPITTNDVVEIIDYQSFKWIGRSDFCINSGGIKLFPEELEQRLGRFISNPYFISSIPDEHLGQAVVMIIQSNIPLEFTKNDFNDLLNPFEIPKYFQVLENFISTPSGKISRTLTQQKTRNNAWRKIL